MAEAIVQHLPASASAFIGRGAVFPLTRKGGDFDVDDGDRLVRSAILLILGTSPGEIPWNPRLGADLTRYRHSNMDDGMVAILRAEIQAALAGQDTRISILGVAAEVDARSSLLRLGVRWALVNRTAAGGGVVSSAYTTEVLA